MRTRRKVALGLLFLLLITGLVIWQFPAALVLQFSKQPELNYGEVSGSVWDGHMEKAVWKGLLLGDVEWQFTGMDSFSPARSRWHVKNKGQQHQLSFDAALEGQALQELHDLHGNLPATWVDLSHSLPLVYLSGLFELNLQQVVMQQQLPVVIDGYIDWQNAGLSGLLNTAIGNLRIDLETPYSGLIEARFSSAPDSAVKFTGQGVLQDNEYRIALNANAPGREDLQELLSKLGRTQADGSVLIRFSGHLLPQGASD